MNRFGSLAALTCGVLFPDLSLGQAFFVEWEIPTPNSEPHCVFGRIWFAGSASNTVGFLDPASGEFREVLVPTANSRPHGIAVSPGDVT